MGVFYHIEPLDDEMATLLDEMGGTAPKFDKPSRNPTPAEVREACATLGGFEVEFNVKPKSRWQAIITNRSDAEGTIVNLEKFKGDEEKPLAMWFEKGPPALILQVVKELAKWCGPLVVVPDTGDVPIAVTAKSVVKKLVAE